MTIDSLYIYPIKSLAGINVQSAEITPRGFKYDRQWMLVDSQGKFVSQREVSELALMKVSIDKDTISVSFKDEIFQFQSSMTSDQCIETTVWNDTFKSTLVDAEVSEWFSDVLGYSLRLVTYSKNGYRIRKPSILDRSIEVSFADGYPYLIIGTSSLEDLNSRLDEKVEMDRFRPNIVVNTNLPFEEDDWKRIDLGLNKLEVVKPCARCIITTINQTTLKRGREPLYTLSKYRQKGNDILFGVNAVSMGDEGIVNIGDTVRKNG